MRARVFLVGLVAACGIACHSNPKPQAPAADAREKHSMPDSVHWVRNSAEYEALTIQAYRQAQDVLGRAIGDRKPGTWAVILDADETVVDNSEYQKEREAQGLKFTSESWRQWTLRKDAGAVPGAVAFLRWVKSKGGTVAIVTNRDKVECDDTEDNLKKLGLQYDVALCMDGDREKEPRFERVKLGTAKPGLAPAEVLMWVGDNIGDFPDLTQALHGKPESDYALFGTRYIVMPNPMYGSWERTERK
jgi:5'-nucleotidase (lipoprotein e(P4) family)